MTRSGILRYRKRPSQDREFELRAPVKSPVTSTPFGRTGNSPRSAPRSAKLCPLPPERGRRADFDHTVPPTDGRSLLARAVGRPERRRRRRPRKHALQSLSHGRKRGRRIPRASPKWNGHISGAWQPGGARGPFAPSDPLAPPSSPRGTYKTMKATGVSARCTSCMQWRS